MDEFHPPSVPTIHLFLNRLDAFPATAQLLLPQAHPVISTTDSQHITGHAPTAAPHHNLKLENLALPVRRVRLVGARSASPDAHSVVLRRGSNVGFAERRRRPSDVAHPVGVARERADVVVGGSGGVVRPQLDEVVGAACHEAAQGSLRLARRRGAGELAGSEGGAPGDGVDAHAVGGEDGVLEGVVLEAEHADGAVGGGGGEVAAGLWG
jgi:hypothetical protein